MKTCLIPLLLAASAFAADVRQFFRPERYERDRVNISPVQPIDEAAWIWLPGHDEWGAEHLFNKTAKTTGMFVRFRKEFKVNGAEPLRIDVSADERFVLLLDDAEVARGPHRGLPVHWNYQSYEIGNLAPGAHVLEAVCWQLGSHAPLAQLSVRGGFILKAAGSYDKQLTTGKAKWQVARLSSTRMTDKGSSRTFGVGDQCEADGTSFLDERPDASAYVLACTVRAPVRKTHYGLKTQGWMLFPTTLPDQMHATKTPGAIRKGPNVLAPGFTVPPNTSVKAYWDLGDYYCAYPELTVRGGKGAIMRWGWTESLRDAKGEKGDRAAIDGKEFTIGMVDTFRADGRPRGFFTAPWWRCGRWCMIEVTTADEPLVLQRVQIAETRYPTPPSAEFRCSDASLDAVQKICVRGMQMCMHEMFFDCPYYEQQMYPGDSRVQYLTVGALNSDDRLIRHAISLYDWDRRENGLIAMNFPTRGTQESSTYTLCWLLMFRDYMMNHADVAWLKARLPGMNHTLMGLAAYEGEDGLLRALPGWSFMDWVPDWKAKRFGPGVAPDGDCPRPNALNNLLYLYALRGAAEVEEAVGERELAAYWRAKAEKLRPAIVAAFWDEARGMMADTLKKDLFSEHAQCLAILADALSPDQRDRAFKGLVETPDLARTTVYFSHYLFDTYMAMGRSDLFLKRLDLWREYVKLNLCTPLEAPGANARSDCHAWGSHPLYHLHTGVLGVKSSAPFFAQVRIAPQPADLRWIKAKTPHPQGLIETDLTFAADVVSGTVTLPGDLTGTFEWKGKTTTLRPGLNSL